MIGTTRVNPRREKMAQWLGVFASLGILVIWLVIISLKQVSPTSSGQVFFVGPWKLDASDIQMIAVCLAGVFTSLFKRPLLMILVFVISFYPFGLYLLGVPSWVRIGGFLDLLFLAATILMASAHYDLTGK